MSPAQRSLEVQMADAVRQADLLAALRRATDNPTAQLGLIYVYGKRLRCAQSDIDAVKQLINASSERAG